MNGPEHYREAERLAALAEQEWGDSQAGDPCPRAVVTAQRAQVHATLALAAATALQTAGIPKDGPTATAWRIQVAL